MTITSSSTCEQLMLAIAQQQLIVSPEMSVMAAIAMMDKKGASCVVVTGAEERELLGIFTERDLIRICTQSIPLAQLTMQSVMSHPVVSIQETVLNNINDVLMLLRTHQIRHLPVLNGDRFMGVLSKDILTDILTQTALNFDSNSIDTVNSELSQSNAQLAESVLKLERNNALSMVMQEASFDGILVIDEHRRVLTYNQQFVRQWLIPPDIIAEGDDRQLLAVALSQLTNPTEFLELVEYLYENPQKISHDEISFIDGRTFDRYSAPIYWENKYYGRIWFFRDISDRKQAEQDLRESQAFIQKIADASPNILYLYDLQEQRNVYTNREIASVLGYEPEVVQAMGTDFFINILHPDDLQNVFPDYSSRMKVAQDGEVVKAEYRMRHANGEWRWLCSRDIVFSRDADGQVKQTIGTAEDISDRKKYEQQLEQTNAELLRATRLKDEFLATVSHELRTPLNAILGMTEGLQEEIFGTLNERQISALQTVERSSYHLLELINDILDVAKIEAGQVELNYSSTAIAQLCQSSMIFVKQYALKKNIQLEMQIAPNLPDISLDERRIRQALINLLNNAVKFTPEGGQIKLEVDRYEDRLNPHHTSWLSFSIIDTGIGIAPENIQKLFRPFIQIDSTLNRKYEGTGLGLALVKQIVNLHEGKVSLTSELGVGSCVTVDIPYKNTVLSPSKSYNLP